MTAQTQTKPYTQNNPHYNLNKRRYWLPIALITCFVAIYGLSFFWLLPQLHSPLHAKLKTLPTAVLLLHTSFGGIALISLLLQWAGRKQIASKHRVIGYLYCFSVTISAMSALIMAKQAMGGIISRIGLTSLAILWLLSTYLAIYWAIKKQYLLHQRWMIISIALCLSAVSLRVQLPLLNIFFAEITAQQIVYYSCWLGNLLIALLCFKPVFFSKQRSLI